MLSDDARSRLRLEAVVTDREVTYPSNVVQSVADRGGGSEVTSQATAIHDFAAAKDPNHVILVRVPGKGNRRMLDTTYEVHVAKGGSWETMGRFPNQYKATAFGQGYLRALQDCGESPAS